MEHQDVINFWFDELGAAGWYKKSTDIDQLITKKFAGLLDQVIAGEMAYWREHALGALAEVIVLDQFSRNIYRDSVKAFTQDPQALCLAQFAIAKGFDKQLSEQQRVFFYMPFMHSESALIHQQAMVFFKGTTNYEFEVKHKAIIDKFGRYPHRNEILGRESTSQEREFLLLPGSSF